MFCLWEPTNLGSTWCLCASRDAINTSRWCKFWCRYATLQAQWQQKMKRQKR